MSKEEESFVEDKYKLSIALVTRNRSESLGRTLESLSKQVYQPYEIIISDDSNDSNCLKVNQQLAQKFNCKYILGPSNGLYSNRNFAAKHCIGTHIRTMDDDHEFPEYHIDECIKAINKEPDTIWTIGEYYPKDFERSLPPAVPGQLHPRGYSYRPKNLIEYYGISCGATLYPRSVIDKDIMNSEAFAFGILYLEYGARLFKFGYTIKPINTTYVIHHYEESSRSITSERIIKGAELFSMLMLSFKHFPSVRNCSLTISEITKNIMIGRYSIKIVWNAFRQFKFESRKY